MIIVLLCFPSFEAKGKVQEDYVLITSFDQNPPGNDHGREWLMLYNPTDTEIDLNGWSFQTNYGGDKVIPIKGIVIPPKSYWTYIYSSGWLRNPDMEVVLKNAEGEEIDKVSGVRDIDNDNRFWQRSSDGEWEFRLQKLKEGIIRKGEVIKVVDGDTIDISPVGKAGLQRFRLVGIDAPESGTPEGENVKQYVRDLCLGEQVWFDVDDREQYDKYNRVLAVIYYIDEVNLNRELLGKGLVQPFIKPPSEFIPYASFTFSPENPAVNQEINLNASPSWTLDPDAAIISYEWDFGDETTGTGKIVSHSFSSVDEYRVSLNVVDSDGENRRSNLTSKSVKVYSGGKTRICGHVNLQGRSDHSGVVIKADEVTTTTDPDGNYSLEISPGTYTVKFDMSGYLPARKFNVDIEAGETIPLPEITLLGGDANKDGKIDAADLTTIASHFNTSNSGSDINGDGLVDILDMVLVGKNFSKGKS